MPFMMYENAVKMFLFVYIYIYNPWKKSNFVV